MRSKTGRCVSCVQDAPTTSSVSNRGYNGNKDPFRAVEPYDKKIKDFDLKDTTYFIISLSLFSTMITTPTSKSLFSIALCTGFVGA